MTQKTAVTVRLSEQSMKVIDADADDNFISRAEAAALKLETACVDGASGPMPQSESAKIRQRKEEAEAQLVEIKLAIARKEFMPTETFRLHLRRAIANIRSHIMTLPTSVPGMDSEQVAGMKKNVEDLLTNLSSGNPPEWDAQPHD
jgi:hypothetical protein